MRREGKLSGWTYTSYRVHTIPREHFFAPPERTPEGCIVGNIGNESTFFRLGGRPSSKRRESAYSCPLGRRCSCCRGDGPRSKGRLKPVWRRLADLSSEGAADADCSWLRAQLREEEDCGSDDNVRWNDDADGSAPEQRGAATFAAFLPAALRGAEEAVATSCVEFEGGDYSPAQSSSSGGGSSMPGDGELLTEVEEGFLFICGAVAAAVKHEAPCGWRGGGAAAALSGREEDCGGRDPHGGAAASARDSDERSGRSGEGHAVTTDEVLPLSSSGGFTSAGGAADRGAAARWRDVVAGEIGRGASRSSSDDGWVLLD